MTDLNNEPTPALTITWQVCGYHRCAADCKADHDHRRRVYMLVDAPPPPYSADREDHFDIASRIAGDGVVFLTAGQIVPSSDDVKHVLLDSKTHRPVCK
jgi:hypothetical protein